jgi:hypothetical protein
MNELRDTPGVIAPCDFDFLMPRLERGKVASCDLCPFPVLALTDIRRHVRKRKGIRLPDQTNRLAGTPHF